MASKTKSSWTWLLVLLIPIAAFIVWAVLAFSGSDTSFNAKREVKIALAQLEKDPKNFSAAMRAGVGYYNLGLFDDSVKYYQLATSIDGSSADAWNNLGNTYREMLRYEDAEVAYKKAQGLKKDLVSVYLNLGELYSRWPQETKDRTAEIPKVLQDGLTNTENDPAILRALIDYFGERGDTAQVDLYQKQLDGQISQAGSR